MVVREESLDHYRARLDGAAISMYILALLAVPSKIWCKTQTGSGWRNVGWDDALSLIALFWTSAFFWLIIIGLRPLLGRHSGPDIPLDELTRFLKIGYVVSMTYVCAIAFIKFTFLGLYWKLFSVATQIPIAITAIVVLVWLITLVCLAAFGCVPIRAQWDLSVTNPRCLNPKAIFLGGSLPNVILDFVIIMIPLPYVWHFITSPGLRVAVAGVFALGFFVCIVSIIRLTILMSLSNGKSDLTFEWKDFLLWSIVEMNVGLTCSCLPSMRPIFRLVFSCRSCPSRCRSSSTSNPNDINQYALSHVNRVHGSRLYSTMEDSSQLEDAEDAVHIIDHAPPPARKNTGECETGRSSCDPEVGPALIP